MILCLFGRVSEDFLAGERLDDNILAENIREVVDIVKLLTRVGSVVDGVGKVYDVLHLLCQTVKLILRYKQLREYSDVFYILTCYHNISPFRKMTSLLGRLYLNLI